MPLGWDYDFITMIKSFVIDEYRNFCIIMYSNISQYGKHRQKTMILFKVQENTYNSNSQGWVGKGKYLNCSQQEN